MDNDLIKHAPGLGGVAVAALLKLKDGWRVMVSQGIAGIVIVMLLRDGWLLICKPLGVPPDVAGFLLGGLGVATFNKLSETVQQLEFARPINGWVERWTGAKAPKEPQQ